MVFRRRRCCVTGIEKAIVFATKAHAGQCRKGKERPFILHPIEVMSIVMRNTFDEDVVIAAVLHDTVEKTSVTLNRIEKEFGPRVARLVASVSEDKMKKLPPEATWRARKWKKIFDLKKGNHDMQLICYADGLSNLRELKRDYEKIGDEVWERFNQKDKEMHAWYYRELLNIFEKTFEYEYYPETDEFNNLVDSIFRERKEYW